MSAKSALAGQVAMVTGAGQGVGQGIALALATEGVDVAVIGRTLSKCEATADLLRERGVQARAYELDVLKTDQIAPLVQRIAADFGRLDIVVNNAYTGTLGPLLEMDQQSYTKGFVSGPFAAFEFMKAAHPFLKDSPNGNIINLVTSAMVKWDLHDYGAYASAKSALRSLSRAAAVEWAKDGIRVNAVAPHALSPALKWWTENRPEEAAEFVAGIPMGRIGDPEGDIGRAVVSLVNPDMKYLTGATIPLDGGQAHF